MSIEEDFKELVNKTYRPKQVRTFFEGENFIDIEQDSFIFNLTLEKKEREHRIILWGLAHKGDLTGEQKQFHGEHFKIIKKRPSKKELKDLVAGLIKQACAAHGGGGTA